VNNDTQQASSLAEYSATRCYSMAFLTVLLVCTSFAAAASCLLLIVYGLTENVQDTGLLFRLGVKAVFFIVATAVSGGVMWATRPTTCANYPGIQVHCSLGWKEGAGLLAILSMIAFEITPNLPRYPWGAPDETHHLVVARNVAAYGLYASGNADAGFKLFDPYDSVGAPVILPVAAALRLAGVDSSPETMLLAARLVAVMYYVILCMAVFFLARTVLGAPSALMGILVMTASFGSTYLARTIYGEVPALAFLVVALYLWREGLREPRASGWLVLAGACFGLSVLCKSIMVLTVFAFLGAYAYDAVTFRRTRWSHFLIPGLCCFFVIAAWWVFQTLFQYDVVTEAGGTLGMYQHNLMFGYRSAGRAIEWMLKEPLALLGILCGMAIAVPILFHKRYDPPLVVLFLTAAFFAFWWIFFTPGQIPRYVWFSYAIGAVLAGAAGWNALRDAFSGRRAWLRRAIGVALAVIVFLPAVERASREVTEIFTIDEMHDDRELALLIQDLPRSAHVSTTYWPLARTLNFLACRNVEVIERVPARIDLGTIVIVDLMTQPDLAKGFRPSMHLGRYAILTGTS
jgi:hypothetical protein